MRMHRATAPTRNYVLADRSLLIISLDSSTGLNETKMASKLHMYLDSCKGASLYIHLAMSYQGNKVRHMRADL